MTYISGGLLGVSSLAAIWVMLQWHRMTGGGWKKWAAGKAMMGLLGVIFLMSGLTALFKFPAFWLLFNFPGGTVVAQWIEIVFALVLLFSIIRIGITIYREQRKAD